MDMSRTRPLAVLLPAALREYWPLFVRLTVRTATVRLSVCGSCQCYFNAALQCLLSIPSLLGFFSSSSPSHSFVRDLHCGSSRSAAAGQLAKSFAALCSQFAAGSSASFSSAGSASVSPSSLLRCFTSLDVSFGDSGQHDSQELLRCLVSRLHDDVNRVRQQPPYEQLNDRADESETQQSERWWHNYAARNRSIITELFAGQLRSEVRCLDCQRRRVAFDPFLDLSLPLPPPHSSLVSLADCFSGFLASERLTGLDAIYCPHCKRHTSSSKTLSLHRLPEVLVLHIKRFEFNSRGGRRKLDTPIAAPLSMELHITAGPHMKPSARRYSLLASINHLGSAHGGHYIAHAKVSGQWYTFDDSHAQAIDAKQMAAQHVHSAYVLFYESSAD